MAVSEEKLIAGAAIRAARGVARGRRRGRKPEGEPRDADMDRRVFEGTPRERYARPGELLDTGRGRQRERTADRGRLGDRYNGKPRGRMRQTAPGVHTDDRPAPKIPGREPEKIPVAPEGRRRVPRSPAQPSVTAATASQPDLPKPKEFLESKPIPELPDDFVPPDNWGKPGSRTEPMPAEEFWQRVAYQLKLADGEWGMGGEHDTNVKHRDANGRWTKERKAMHQRIMDEWFAEQEAADVGYEGKAIMLGGAPGAGKSSLVDKNREHIFRGSNYATINPDDFKERIINQPGGMDKLPPGVTPAEFASLVHEESSYLADLASHLARQKRMNAVFDITMNGRNAKGGYVSDILVPLHGGKIEADPDLMDAGVTGESTPEYDEIRAVFVDADPEVSEANTFRRWFDGVNQFEVSTEENPNGKGQGGRAVPPTVAQDIIDQSREFRTRPRWNLQREAEQGSFDEVEVYGHNNPKPNPPEQGGGYGFDGFALRSSWPGEVSDKSDEDLVKEMGRLGAIIATEKQKRPDKEDWRDEEVQGPIAELSAIKMERAKRARASEHALSMMGTLASGEQASSQQREAFRSFMVGDISPTGSPDGAGTPEDPIDVGGDLDRAVELLSEGKSVRLDQPEQVSTLVKKLADLGRKAHEAGEEAPDIDLCKVTVKGTNLFCHDHKGIPRIEMPQLKAKAVPDESAAALFRNEAGKVDLKQTFSESLMAAGIAAEDRSMPASHLRSTQSQLDGVQVGQMVEAIHKGTIPTGGKPDGRIFVTRDGYIIDGHHNWAAQVTADAEDGRIGDVKMNVTQLDIDIGSAMDYANAFTKQLGVPQQEHGAQRKPLVGKGSDDDPRVTAVREEIRRLRIPVSPDAEITADDTGVTIHGSTRNNTEDAFLKVDNNDRWTLQVGSEPPMSLGQSPRPGDLVAGISRAIEAGWFGSPPGVAERGRARDRAAERGARLKREYEDKGVTPERVALADAKHEALAAIEPDITSSLTSVAEGVGGTMIGLNNRFKKSETMASKIDRINHERMDADPPLAPLSDEEAIASIKDGLRYTMELPGGEWSKASQGVINDFRARGFTTLAVKNSMEVPSATGYKGMNVHFEDAQGNRFEVQFHTPETSELKAKVHPIYAAARGTDVSDADKMAAVAQMVAMAMETPTPPGAADVKRLRPAVAVSGQRATL